jgi:hypothetical protein
MVVRRPAGIRRAGGAIPRRARSRRPLHTSFVALLTACAVQEPAVFTGDKAPFAVAPESLTLDVMQRVTLSVAGDTGMVRFSADAPAVAGVDAGGRVHARSPGRTVIRVRRGTERVDVPVSVSLRPAELAFIEGVPAVAVLAPGETARLSTDQFDTMGRGVVYGVPTYRSLDPTVATVGTDGRLVAKALGESAVIVTLGTATDTIQVRVADGGSAAAIDVFPQKTYQPMTGWEGSTQLGQLDCAPEAYARYKPELVDRLVNELGINRVRLHVRSGMEHRTDYFTPFRRGAVLREVAGNLMVAENDNDDPFVADSTGFQWGWFDHEVEQVVLPMREALRRRGEALYLNLSYVDFYLDAPAKAFAQMQVPDEYAELIVETFRHMQAKYGFVPDGLEVVLEPENSPYRPAAIGASIIAVRERLARAGFRPDIIGPTYTRTANAIEWHDAMLQSVPGHRLVDVIGYHRYGGLSRPVLRGIAIRGRRDGAQTAMLEYIDGGFDALYDDLTIGRVSAWQQFALAYCGRRDNPGNGGVYYQVNQADPLNPRINITDRARLLRQVFHYVRAGATRLGVASGDDDVRPLAFRNANGGQVTVIWTKGPAPLTVRGLAAGTYGVNFSTPTGRYNVELPDIDVPAGDALEVRMPEAGVITIFAR